MSHIHSLFPQKVKLIEETHQYIHDDGREFMSFSRMFGFLSAKFDAEFIASQTAKRDGITKEEVLGKWNAQTENGTRIDKALELFSKTGQILKEDEYLEPLIKAVLEKYKEYHSTYEQVVVYDEEYRVAGSMDKLGILSNRRDSSFHIADFKVFEGGMKYEAKGQKWLNYPFDYMLNCKYNRISVQLSFYARLFEKLTARRCERLFIDLIQPVNNNNKLTYKLHQIPVPYLKPQIDTLLDTFKDKILRELDKPVGIIYDEEF